MKSHAAEMLDLALTQAIERYVDMPQNEIWDVILEEWPEQIAVLLIELLFKPVCRECTSSVNYISIERESGHGNYIIPLCACDTKPYGDYL